MKFNTALMFGIMAIGLSITTTGQAETISGQVVQKKGNDITVKTQDGSEKSMQLNDNTTYRKKKILKHGKIHLGKKLNKGDSYYKPLLEEDDWVEIIYTPAPTEGWWIEEVTVYDD